MFSVASCSLRHHFEIKKNKIGFNLGTKLLKKELLNNRASGRVFIFYLFLFAFFKNPACESGSLFYLTTFFFSSRSCCIGSICGLHLFLLSPRIPIRFSVMFLDLGFSLLVFQRCRMLLPNFSFDLPKCKFQRDTTVVIFLLFLFMSDIFCFR